MIGQIFIGIPGCGKTSFCFSMKKIINSTEEIPVSINLDPGSNLNLLNFDINIQELIISYEIIPELNLGPNGALLYAIEYFEKNNDWLEKKIANTIEIKNFCHFLFDFPGQIELFTHHLAFRNVIKRIISRKIKLIAINFTDSFFLKDKSSNNSLLLVYIIIMLNIELPHIHLISKIDLFQKKNAIPNLDKQTIKYIYSNFIFYKCSFFWSKKMSYDLAYLIMEFSTIISIPVSVYYPSSINLIYKKIKNTLVS